MLPLLWKSLWSILRRLGLEVLLIPAIPLLGIFPEKLKRSYHSDICGSMFIAAQFVIAKSWKQPRCPSTRVDEKVVVFLYNELLLSYKKDDLEALIGKSRQFETLH